jgi:hypothetical protein
MALGGWTSPVTVKAITRTSQDFVITETVAFRTIQAMVQPTQKTLLNAAVLNWQQAHITIFTPDPVKNGELVEYAGADYKVVEVADWSQYGYFEAVCEATGKAVLQETEAP